MTNERRRTCDCNKHLCLFLLYILSSRRSRGAWIGGDDSWTTTPDQARNITGALISWIHGVLWMKVKVNVMSSKRKLSQICHECSLNNAWLQFSLSYSTRILSLSSHSVCLSVSAIVTLYLFSIILCDTNTNTQIQLVVWWFFKSHGTPFIQLLEYANPPPLSSLFTLSQKIRMAKFWKRKELSEIHWCHFQCRLKLWD